MPIRPLMDRTSLEQVLLSRLSRGEGQLWVQKYFQPYRELMSYYRCAIMEVETKFNVLNEELSLQYDRNPIETIKTRLKSPESIMEKLSRRGYPMTVESIEQNLNDIAGVRVICSHPSDIYKLSDALLRQDDIRLIERKDYIANPKPNGYRSLHLIVEAFLRIGEGYRKGIDSRCSSPRRTFSIRRKGCGLFPPLPVRRSSGAFPCAHRAVR